MQNYNEPLKNLNGEGKKFAIITSRYNEEITENLTKGALKSLEEHGVSPTDIKVFSVPGAFELPLFCQKLGKTYHYDGLIALGCVVRGDTPHFDYVCAETTRGIGQVSLETGIPIGFGLLTTDNLKQAQLRSNLDGDNKGVEAALTTLEMVQKLSNL